MAVIEIIILRCLSGWLFSSGELIAIPYKIRLENSQPDCQRNIIISITAISIIQLGVANPATTNFLPSLSFGYT